MTLSQLAARMDKSGAYLSMVERNLAEVSISALKDIAEALDVKISWFFQGDGEVPDNERPFIVRKDNRPHTPVYRYRRQRRTAVARIQR